MHARKTLSLAAFAALLVSPSLHAADKAQVGAAISSSQVVSFDVYLPLRQRAQLEALLTALHTTGSSQYGKWLTPAQFDAQFSPLPAQVATIQAGLSSSALTVTQVSPRHLHVTGKASDVERVLNTQLHDGVFRNGAHRVVMTGVPALPSYLAEAGGMVTGLSTMVRMQSHSRHSATPANRYSTAGPYWFDDLKQAYAYPSYTAYNGKGVHIGILMAGDYQLSDMTQYFSFEGLATPSYDEVQINGGAPFDPNGGSFETSLDLEQSGGMAPKAKITLYNIPDLSDDSILAGLDRIVEDNKVDVVSMSFGGPEVYYTPAFNEGEDFGYLLKEEDDLIAQGVAEGITFVASSGDSGALSAAPLACLEGESPCGNFQASAEFPASSPHVVGVGGTNLATTYSQTSLTSKYVSEEAYADPLTADIFYDTAATGGFWGSGGGDSIYFKKPLFQWLVNTGDSQYRTVPDLALHMGGCPANATCNPDDSADWEVVGGEYAGVIGTSASAPDFAGLVALTVERLGTRLGNANTYIYALAAAQNIGLLPEPVFHKGIPGFNGLYSAGASYNKVLGNGTLYGRNFLLAPLAPAAGNPQTPSNP